MPERGDEHRLREVEEWFREKNVRLDYERLGAPPDERWVALMVPDDQLFGSVDRGQGKTKVEAAEDALARYLEAHPSFREISKSGSLVAGTAIGGTTASARAEAPRPAVKIEVPTLTHKRAVYAPTVSVDPATLKRALHTRGLRVYFTDLGDGRVAIRAVDDSGKRLAWLIRDDLDDAFLDAWIEAKGSFSGDA
jgi:hypothetical protein